MIIPIRAAAKARVAARVTCVPVAGASSFVGCRFPRGGSLCEVHQDRGRVVAGIEDVAQCLRGDLFTSVDRGVVVGAADLCAGEEAFAVQIGHDRQNGGVGELSVGHRSQNVVHRHVLRSGIPHHVHDVGFERAQLSHWSIVSTGAGAVH